MPVLPLVASRIVLPGASAPERSPSSVMPSAARSFTDPLGLRCSALAYTSTPAGTPAVVPATRVRWRSGVFPTCVEDAAILCRPGRHRRSGQPARPTVGLATWLRNASSRARLRYLIGVTVRRRRSRTAAPTPARAKHFTVWRHARRAAIRPDGRSTPVAGTGVRPAVCLQFCSVGPRVSSTRPVPHHSVGVAGAANH